MASGQGPRGARGGSARGTGGADKGAASVRALVLVLAAAQCMAVSSNTAIAVALPPIGRAFHATGQQLQWTMDSYTLSIGSLMLISGVIGDRVGHRRLLLTGLTLFAVGSLGDALAPTPGWLFASRVVQGGGPALVTPASLAIITRTIVDPRRRAPALGVWSMSSGIGMAIAPVVGGLIVALLGWQWVFLANVPVSLALLALDAAMLPHDSAAERGPARFDLVGALLAVLAPAAVTFGLIEGQAHGFGSLPVLSAFALGATAVAAFLAWEARREEPLVDVALFRNPSFSISNLAALSIFFAFIGLTVYLSGFFQQVEAQSMALAALHMLPIGAGFALAAPCSGMIVARLGPRLPMAAGLALCGIATLSLVRLTPGAAYAPTAIAFVVVGAGAGLSMTPMTTSAVAAAAQGRAGMASGMLNLARTLGVALGVAVLGGLVFAGVPAHLAGGKLLAGAAGQAYVAGLHRAVLVCGCTLLAAAMLAERFLPRRTPAPAPVAHEAAAAAAAGEAVL